MVFNIHRNTHNPTAGSHYPNPDPQAIIDNSIQTSPPVEIQIQPNSGQNQTTTTSGTSIPNTSDRIAANFGPGSGYGSSTAPMTTTYGSSLHPGGAYGSTGSVDNRTSTATMLGAGAGTGTGTGTGTGYGYGNDSGYPKTIVTLSPVATPQALGLAAWATALFVFSSYLADWFGTYSTGNTIWPFILAFGGLGQFAAGMWSYNARDTLNSALHTMWGCFWLSVGTYYAYSGPSGATPINIWGRIDAFAIWQIPVGVFTWAACTAALFRDWTLMIILVLNAIGCTLSVIGWFSSSIGCLETGAYFWLASCLGMWYRVTAHFLSDASDSTRHLPVWRRHRPAARNPLERERCEHQWVAPYREAGVVQGEW